MFSGKVARVFLHCYIDKSFINVTEKNVVLNLPGRRERLYTLENVFPCSLGLFDRSGGCLPWKTLEWS